MKRRRQTPPTPPTSGPTPPARGTSRGPRLRSTWLTWKQAADWVDEQDARRAAEQRRFAEERLRLGLEALWTTPAWTDPSAGIPG